MFMLDIVDFYNGALIGLVATVVIAFFGAILASHKGLWNYRPSSTDLDHTKHDDDLLDG